MLDIHTVGAGGGSLARFDRAGILHVGPESAGADPGPICYGRGELPTVTDANLVLGRLDAELALAGSVHLDEARTRRLMEMSRGNISSVEEFASGIVRLAEAEMEKAIRLISVERGYDPREFTLLAFGGAGPLHACALAQALRIPRVLVPVMPGALSALGILGADVVRDYSRTVMVPCRSAADALNSPTRSEQPSELTKHFSELEQRAAAEFRKESMKGTSIRSADLRYTGQGYEINVAAGPRMLGAFHQDHSKRYGHADPSKPVEVVNVRVRMVASSGPLPVAKKACGDANCRDAVLKRKNVRFGNEWINTEVLDRNLLMPGNSFQGPAIVHEYSATTVIPARWKARVDEYSNMVVEVV
jgi:N-methylhydantoinase A